MEFLQKSNEVIDKPIFLNSPLLSRETARFARASHQLIKRWFRKALVVKTLLVALFATFLAYCLQVTLEARLRPIAVGITPRHLLAKVKTIQMVDVCIRATDGCELVLPRYTQPEAEHRMLQQ